MKILSVIFMMVLTMSQVKAEHVELKGKGEYAGHKCQVSYDVEGNKITNLKYSGEEKNWQILFGTPGNIKPGSMVSEYSNAHKVLEDYFGKVITMHEARDDSYKSRELKIYAIMNGSFTIKIEGDLTNPKSFSYKQSAYFWAIKVDQSRAKCNF